MAARIRRSCISAKTERWEKIDAQGHVRMKTDTGATGRRGDGADLDGREEPADPGRFGRWCAVRLGAGERDDARIGQRRNAAVRTVSAGPHAQTGLRHGEFRQNVTFDEVVTGLAKDPRGHAAKQLHAEKVDVEFAPPQAGQPVEARKAIAEGSSVVTSRQTPSKGPEQTTRISGDQLVATFGRGERAAPAGMEQAIRRSRSRQRMDRTMRRRAMFSMRFSSSSRRRSRKITVRLQRVRRTRGGTKQERKKTRARRCRPALETAIQDGNVVLTETPREKSREQRRNRQR